MLQVQDISFGYNKHNTISNLIFELESGKNLAILGESGCGKSTLLKLLYGMYDLKSGAIFFEDKPILGPKFKLLPGDDFSKYLAQDFGLMPYSTVAENVGSFLSNMFPEKKQGRIDELLEMVEMIDYKHIKPQFLSGGQQQRVALAKVLALEPKLLLLDEPFSQIDAFRKNALRRNLFHYLKQKNISCIIATHDSSDALSFTDETIILKNGKVIAKGISKALYQNPTNYYCASLFGEVNEIPEKYLSISDSEKKLLVYASQLKVTNESLLKVEVLFSYYRGNVYLIKAKYIGGIIFFEHHSELNQNMICFLALQEK